MTQSPSSSPCSTSHSTVPWAKSLISRSTATPQPSIIIPVWPVGTNDGPVAGGQRRSAKLEGDRHLADRAVGPDRQDHPLARAVAAPDGRLHPLRRPAVVDDPRPARAAAAAANSGSSPMNVWRPDRTSSPAAIAARMIVRQAAGSLPPVGAIPISSASGGVGQGERLVEGRDDRDVVAGQEGRHVLAGPGRIEDRDDVVAAVADDAIGGLGAVGTELAFGQDDEAAEVGRSHRPV